MNREIENEIRERVEVYFSGYKVKRVSSHLDKVVLDRVSTLSLFKKIIGLKYHKQHRIIEFTKDFTITGRYNGKDFKYDINTAIDEATKTVYWKPY